MNNKDEFLPVTIMDLSNNVICEEKCEEKKRKEKKRKEKKNVKKKKITNLIFYYFHLYFLLQI